jgi:hypothetical protein
MATMKHIIALFVLTVFTVAVAQAGDECCKDKAACDAKAKAAKVAKKGSTPLKGAQVLVMK